MGRTGFIAPFLLAIAASSCAFILDFDELQEGSGGSAGAGGKGGSGGSTGGSGGTQDLGGNGGAPGDEGIPLEDAALVMADALCSKIEACVGPALMVFLFNEESCVGTVTAVLQDSVVANIEASEENGTLEYDPTALPACLAAFEALDCTEVTVAFPEQCKQAINSSLKEGDDCQHSLECEGDLYCSTGVCPGTCSRPLEEGEACTEADPCAAGLTCFEGSCEPLGDEGDECGGTVLPECLLGLFCVGSNDNDMTPGTCYPAIDLFSANEGQSCNFGATPTLCDEGLSCPLLSLNASCLAPAEPDGECTGFTVPDMCPEGQSCQGGVCTDIPGVGEPCGLAAFGKGGCRENLRCVSGTCRRVGPNGNTCVDDLECWSGFCSEGLCAAPRCPD